MWLSPRCWSGVIAAHSAARELDIDGVVHLGRQSQLTTFVQQLVESRFVKKTGACFTLWAGRGEGASITGGRSPCRRTA
jgi:hypothetical protein